MTTITQNKQDAASALSIEPTRIGTMRMELGVLRNRGLLIALDICGTSIFATQTDWADLGIAGDDPRSKRLTRGRKYLIPESIVKQRRSIEVRARQLLDRLTYEVRGFHPYRFLPFEAYEKFKAVWEGLLADDADFKSSLLASLDDYRDEAAADFAQIAIAAWSTLQATGNDCYYPDPDGFADSILARALAKFPTPGDIQTKLTMDYRVSMAFGVDALVEQETRAKLTAEQAQLEIARLRAQAASEQETARHEAEINRLEEAERNARYDAIRQAEAEHYRAQLNESAGPLSEMFLDLRNRLAEAAVEMAESVEKSGFVRGKVAQRGRGLLEIFNLMSVTDDRDLKDALVKLNQAIGPGSEESGKSPERSPEEVKAALEKIVELAEEARAEITSPQSRFAGLRVLSELEVEEVA